MVDLPFENVLDAVPVVGVELGSTSRLRRCDARTPFVAPTFEAGTKQLAAEVWLVDAPAAVGKSTLANQVAAVRGLPLLDLAQVAVSTDSLAGLLQSVTVPGDAVLAFHRGDLPVVVDALDEGRILSGEQNFESFLETTWDLLRQDRSTRDRPKLVLLGRPETVDLVELSLKMEADDVTWQRLHVSFFTEQEARDLVLAYADLEGVEDAQFRQHPQPADELVSAYFGAIERALRLPGGELWATPHGRSFAGYAPVLAALGAFLAGAENLMDVTNRLSGTAHNDAWEVIEVVAEEILNREQKQLCSALTHRVTGGVPDAAYDRSEQMGALARYVDGRDPREGLAAAFASPNDQSQYHSAVVQRLPEHPFLRSGQFSNAVLASIVLADAISRETLTKKPVEILGSESRQPFLWRSFRSRLRNGDLVDGKYLGFLLASMWSEPEHSTTHVGITSMGDGSASVEIDAAGAPRVELSVTLPLEFYGELRATGVAVDGTVTCHGHALHGPTTAFFFRDSVDLIASALTIDAQTIVVEGRSWIEADELDQPGHFTLRVSSDASTGWGGAVADRYPWNQHDQSLDGPSWRHVGDEVETDSLAGLLRECWNRLPSGSPMTLERGYRLPGDDQRVQWAARMYDDRLGEVVRILVDIGLASQQPAQAGGGPKIRVHFDTTWEELFRASIGKGHPNSPLAPKLGEFVARADKLFG